MLNDILNRLRPQRGHEPTVISLGQTWVDMIMHVNAMPEIGEFTEAQSVTHSVSGSFRVLQTARKMGARAQLASILGTGPYADMIEHALHTADVQHIGHTQPNQDNGFRVVLAESGKKAFIAHHGAEARGDAETFRNIAPAAGDVLHISGNALMNESSRAVNAFIQRTPCHPKNREFQIVLNPTNTLRLVNDRLLENLVLIRPIWSMNRQQARTLADRLGIRLEERTTMHVHADFDENMLNLCTELGKVLHAPIVLRAGARGAWVSQPRHEVAHIDGFPTKATHIRSAGPIHTGTLCALLARGTDLTEAVQIANAAASLSITNNHNGVPFCPSFDAAVTLAATHTTETAQ